MMSTQPIRRRHFSLADCDIVKKGSLHIKRPPSTVKIRLKVGRSLCILGEVRSGRRLRGKLGSLRTDYPKIRPNPWNIGAGFLWSFNLL